MWFKKRREATVAKSNDALAAQNNLLREMLDQTAQLKAQIASGHGGLMVITSAFQHLLLHAAGLDGGAAMVDAVRADVAGLIALLHQKNLPTAYLDGADEAGATIAAPRPSRDRSPPFPWQSPL